MNHEKFMSNVNAIYSVIMIALIIIFAISQIVKCV